MEPFKTFCSRIVALDRIDVDTDAILPKQYMAMIGRQGFGPYLFDNWRYLDEGQPGDDCKRRRVNPNFVLNDPRIQGARILLSRANFGCGSSREHAVWALAEWGIRTLIAPSFGEIFYGNCIKNGLLPIRLDEHIVDELFTLTRNDAALDLTIDLDHQQICHAVNARYSFEIATGHKQMLLSGLDEIGQTLALYRNKITAFEKQHLTQEPWLARPA